MTIVQVPALNLTGINPAELGWHRETSFLRAYPPKGEPNVFVIGAYSGTIAGLLIEQMPQAKHCLFEPQDWACKTLHEKFNSKGDIKICRFGLGDRNGVFRMALYTGNDCTFMRNPVPFGEGTWFDGNLFEFGAFMREAMLESVYYASLNIEGYEYVLIPHMAKTGWLRRCQCIGISWHDKRFNSPVPGPYTWEGEKVPTYEDMQELLGKTHDLVLEIDNWQSWVRREI